MLVSGTFWAVAALSALGFWLLPRPARIPALTLVSTSYLLTIEPAGVLALLAWALAFYYLAPLGRRGLGWPVPLLVLAILGYLAWFKYAPPLLAALRGESVAAQLAIPLGISYFTFKLIHYAVEVGRGNVTDRSLASFLCYLFLFPIFSAGPIERFDHFLAHREERWSPDSTVWGLTRIAQGLVKKFVLAAALSALLGGGERAARSASSGARARIAWCIVGTAVYQVGRCSSSQRQKRAAWKPGVATTLAPAARDDRVAAIRPWMWNSGMTFRQRSPGPSCSVAPMWAAEAHRLRWLRGTILGREVVPEVCSTSATSSGPAKPVSRGGPTGSPRSVNTPAGASSATATPITGMPSVRAASMAGPPIRSGPSGTSSTRAPVSAR